MPAPEFELLKDIGLPAGYVALLAVIYYLIRLVKSTQSFAEKIVLAVGAHTTVLVEVTTLLKVLVSNAREDRR